MPKAKPVVRKNPKLPKRDPELEALSGGSVVAMHQGPVKLIPISEIKRNPRNRNKHPKEQIERIAKLLRRYGWRKPLIVSNQSGLLVVGHGRLDAAILNGETRVPVQFQDFASPDEEHAFGISDNAISEWSELDLAGINEDLADLGPDFDIDDLGIKNFHLDVSEIDFPDLKAGEQGDLRTMTFILTADQKNFIEEALRKAKAAGATPQAENEKEPGAALTYICKIFLSLL